MRSYDWLVFRGLSYSSLPLFIIKVVLVSYTSQRNMEQMGTEDQDFIDMPDNR
jgi:hypothetical protein